MRQIPLTKGKFALVDDADYEPLTKFKWRAHCICGIWYALADRRVGGKRYCLLMHRVILGLSDRNLYCDHIDHDGLNNQRENLRIVTNSQNQANRRGLAKNNTSGHTGVSWIKNLQKWRAVFHGNKRRVWLGVFAKKEDAVKTYQDYRKMALAQPEKP